MIFRRSIITPDIIRNLGRGSEISNIWSLDHCLLFKWGSGWLDLRPINRALLAAESRDWRHGPGRARSWKLHHRWFMGEKYSYEKLLHALQPPSFKVWVDLFGLRATKSVIYFGLKIFSWTYLLTGMSFFDTILEFINLFYPLWIRRRRVTKDTLTAASSQSQFDFFQWGNT